MKRARDNFSSTGCSPRGALLLLAFLFLSSVGHASANSGITYHGRILKADGSALEGKAVQFKMQIRSPGNESCLLYEEVQTINMAGSTGVFSISLNDGTGTRDDSSGIGFDNVFSNRTSLTFPAGVCATGTTYLPNSGDGRSFVVSFRDENMAAYEPLPPQAVNFSPMAIQAKQIGGFGPNNLLRVDDATSAANTSAMNTSQFNAIMAVANGTAPYVSSSSNGANLPIVSSAPTTPTTGSIWYNSTSGTLQYYNGSTSQTLGTGGTGTVTSISTGTGLTGGPITTSGTIALSTFGTVGTYYKVVTDATGRVASGSTALVEADIPTLSTAGKVSGSAISSGTIAGTTVINTSGNITGAVFKANSVGIGTASPSAALDVYGAINLSGLTGISFPATDSTAGGSVAVGAGALVHEGSLASTAFENTAVGYQAIGSSSLTTAAYSNTAVGYQALASNSSGSSNTGMGVGALNQTTSGAANVAIGVSAGNNNTTGGSMTALGYAALYNSNSNNNTGIGNYSGHSITLGASNTVIGYGVASSTLTTGSNNILIGTSNAVDTPTAATSNFLNIGSIIFATGVTGTVSSPGGYVGIGTASPQALLDINGMQHMVANASPPVACAPTYDGNMARTSHYTFCICKGGTNAWVSTNDGTTACTW